MKQNIMKNVEITDRTLLFEVGPQRFSLVYGEVFEVPYRFSSLNRVAPDENNHISTEEDAHARRDIKSSGGAE